jgi:hypothetical protein
MWIKLSADSRAGFGLLPPAVLRLRDVRRYEARRKSGPHGIYEYTP